MKNWVEVNQRIANRNPCTSFEDNTYYTIPLFEHFCDNRDYKYVAIFGYYKNKYDWSNEEATEMYLKAPDGWTDGVGVYRLYDWGKGANKIRCGDDWEWHEPQLDHIIPKSKPGTSNKPSNFQILPAILNRILSNLTDDMAPAILPILISQFPNVQIT
jgi:hypothetical protein